MSGVVNVLALTGAFFMLQVYDRVVPGRSVPTLVGLAVFAATLFVFQGVLELIRSRLMVRLGQGLDAKLSPSVYPALMRLPLRAKLPGDGLQPLRDLDQVRSFIGSAGPTALFDLPWMPLYIGICFIFHFWIGVTALAGAVVLFALTLLAEFRTRGPTKDRRTARSRPQHVGGGDKAQCRSHAGYGFWRAYRRAVVCRQCRLPERPCGSQRCCGNAWHDFQDPAIDAAIRQCWRSALIWSSSKRRPAAS